MQRIHLGTAVAHACPVEQVPAAGRRLGLGSGNTKSCRGLLLGPLRPDAQWSPLCDSLGSCLGTAACGHLSGVPEKTALQPVALARVVRASLIAAGRCRLRCASESDARTNDAACWCRSTCPKSDCLGPS